MWGWLKGLWSSKGSGGCITVDGNGPVTLTPLEPKLSSRSSKGLNQDGTGVHQAVKQLAQVATDDSTPQQNQRQNQQQQQRGLGALHPDSSRAPDQHGNSGAVELPPSAGRYIYSGGKPVGIANTVKRYHESRPLRPHLTPFEARLEAKIAEEEVAAAVLQASGAPGSTKKQLFDAQ